MVFSSSKCTENRFWPGLRPGPYWGSLRRSHRPPRRLGPIPLLSRRLWRPDPRRLRRLDLAAFGGSVLDAWRLSFSVYPPLFLAIHHCMYVCMYVFIHLFIYSFIYLFIYLFIYSVFSRITFVIFPMPIIMKWQSTRHTWPRLGLFDERAKFHLKIITTFILHAIMGTKFFTVWLRVCLVVRFLSADKDYKLWCWLVGLWVYFILDEPGKADSLVCVMS